MVLQAGSKYRESYEALPLEVSGHNITATLIIHNPKEDAEQFEYYLEVTNEVGTQRYIGLRLTNVVITYFFHTYFRLFFYLPFIGSR